MVCRQLRLRRRDETGAIVGVDLAGRLFSRIRQIVSFDDHPI
jgi:hypothetical protein